MGALREQMEREMVLRRMSVTHAAAYSQAVAALARHYRRRPDQLTEREIQAYLLYLIEERKLAYSSCNVALHGLRLFYHETLKREQMQFRLAPGTRAAEVAADPESRRDRTPVCGGDAVQAPSAADDDLWGGTARVGGVCPASRGHRQSSA